VLATIILFALMLLEINNKYNVIKMNLNLYFRYIII